MPALNLHVSNRLDLLAAALGEVTSRPLDSPFTPEIVVVQSLATRRWLSLRLAEFTGVFANYEFPFLGELVARCVKAATGDAAAAERPSIELLTWRIESALRQCVDGEESSAVCRYLSDGDSLKRFTLSGRIANLFDQYRLYRPDLLLKWSAGFMDVRGHEAWQSKLWAEVDGASAFGRAVAEIRTNGFPQPVGSEFPARVSVFAPTGLPPAYLDLLFQLGQVRDVHLFLLRPSAVYHGDDVNQKRRAKLGSEEKDAETGNPLLASWGRTDAEFTNLIIDAEERLGITAHTASERFHEVEPNDILTTIQHDIFSGCSRGVEKDEPKFTVTAGDDSLRVNVCHSPMREVEVLYDHLLDCFERFPTLRPRDILVMTPSIEEYAPLVRAVFGFPENDSMRIPHSIADRHPRSESGVIDMFLTLLALTDSRYTAPEIFALLSSRGLRRRFGFTEEDLSRIRAWIHATAIRWGIDGQHRSTKGVPAVEANTWRHGLNRLLLGFAMTGKEKRLFADILPQDDVEGEAAETLGRFATAAEALFSIASTFGPSRPLGDWVEPLLNVLNTFAQALDEDDARDLRHVRSVIESLSSFAQGSAEADIVDFKAVRQFLETQLGAMEQRGSFFKGGVTFCALKPVRSIPAEVICLLGINDQVFPRRPQVARFDLMAERRAGDPSAAADDRFSFLETLLCARRKLLISYVGRSVQDNKKIPPSVVLSELFDYLNEGFEFPAVASAEEFLRVDHPLHAFSKHYFSAARSDKRLYSYSKANAEAAKTILSGETSALEPFIAEPLPAVVPRQCDIELSELLRFWRSPCQYFLRRRIGLELEDTEEALSSDEPFELGPREQYPIKQELLGARLGFSEAATPQAFAARGTLPPGMIGELQLRSIDAVVGRFATVVQHHLSTGKRDEPKEVKLVLNDFTLSGRLNSLYGGTVLHFRCAKLKAVDQLRAWMEHLALCAITNDESGKTTLIGTDAIITFKAVTNSRELLENLCRLMEKGRTYPLPFFPATALAYVSAEAADADDPFKPAHQKWYGSWNQSGEKDDDFVARCFNANDPLDEQFVEVARAVFAPLIANATTKAMS